MKNEVFAAIMALTATLCAASSTAAQDASWAEGVRADGWPDGRLTTDGDMIIFRRPAAKGPQGFPRLQIRHEYRQGRRMGGRAYFSLLALDEYDCKAARFRNLRMAAFTRHNAEGESVQDNSGEDWKTAAPGTVDAKSLAAACGR